MVAELDRLGKLASQPADDGKAERRKRRHVIRHTCQVNIEMVIGHRAATASDWSVDAIKVRGKLLDLSNDGASLYTKQPLETGQELRLAIALNEEFTLHTTGTVRWVKDLPEKKAYASGAQFGPITDADRRTLEKFLKEIDTTAGL